MQNFDNLSVETIRLALSYITPDLPRDEWARVAMGLKTELGDAGWQLFDDWSCNGDSYNPNDARDTWKSVRAGGGVTIATVMKLAIDSGYKPDGKPTQITPEEAAERRAKRAADELREEQERIRKQESAAEDARAIWDAARPIQPGDSHPYLARKSITETGNVRIGTYTRRYRDDETGDWLTAHIDGALLIPVRDAAQKLTSVQAYFRDDSNPLGRDRDYLPGGRKQGCYFNIGKPTGERDEIILIAEGYATMCRARMATGFVSVCAFDAGNLAAVAKIIRDKLPNARIIICGDNDQYKPPKNPGRDAANAAAHACGGLVALPKFADTTSQPTDFDDLARLEGDDAVRDQIMMAVKPAALMPAKNAAHVALAEFGEPIDVFGVQPPPALPLELLPDCFQDYVQDQSELIGCDPAIVGISALVAAASVIDDAIKLQPKRRDPTWHECARLWVAFVGDPSTKKSPGISKGVRHVKRLNHAQADANDAAMGEYRVQHEAWKDAKKLEKSLPEPPKPAIKRLIVEDATIEALSDILKDNPKGVLILKDELTGWFASMDAYKGANKGASMDRAHWLEAYEGGPRSVDRVTRGNIRVPNWSTCIIGGIQPEMIQRVANNMGNDGLLQRFMIIVARPATMDADRVPDMDAMQRFGELFDHLHGLGYGADAIRLSEDAHVCRERVSKYANRMIQAFDHAHLTAWLGKWSGLFGRLLTTYHVIECATNHQHPTTVEVSGHTAYKVERLMLSYLLRHAIHFYTEILDANDKQAHIRQLARLILAKRMDRITKRDITVQWSASRRMQWWEIRGIIDALCTMDWLSPELDAIDTDGKPRAWTVNPKVHDAFVSYAAIEAERRREVSETIREMKAAYFD